MPPALETWAPNSTADSLSVVRRYPRVPGVHAPVRIPATLPLRGRPCPHAVRAVANRLAARGRRAHRALLVAVCAAQRRSLRVAHRGHRRDARAPRGDRADPALAALGRAGLG